MARNTIWNVVGQVSPLLIAAFAIPLLIKRLGVDRFGVLTLAWALVGYFSLFDLGLGRALTKVVSDRLAAGKERQVAAAIWTATIMMFAVGAVFAIAICLARQWMTNSLLKVPASLHRETYAALLPLGLSIPIITITTGLRGVLEAQHRFAMVNSVRVVMGAFSFLGPLAASFVSPSLYGVITVLILGRVVSCVIYLMMCLRTTHGLGKKFIWDRETLPELLSTGGWITVSNLVSPLMAYSDRFLITYFLSVSVVAYYTTPFEMVTKLWLVPTSIAGVLFPAFAALAVIDRQRLTRTYERGVRSCFVVLYPVIFLIIMFAPEVLQVWLGTTFMRQSTIVLRWLAAGVLLNSIANMPYALLQAVNRPDLPGKVHLIEVPLYLAGAVWAITHYGLPGAAAVWAIRLSLEAVVLFILAQRTLVPGALGPRLITFLALGVAVLAAITLEHGLWTKVLTAALVLTSYWMIAWRLGLDEPERQQLRSWLNSLIPARQ